MFQLRNQYASLLIDPLGIPDAFLVLGRGVQWGHVDSAKGSTRLVAAVAAPMELPQTPTSEQVSRIPFFLPLL